VTSMFNISGGQENPSLKGGEMKNKTLAFFALLAFLCGPITLVYASNGTADQPNQITICSFNIQFLGSSKHRNDEVLASVVKDCDVVVVQELVAPPYAMKFPDGTDAKPDPEAAEFFDAMSQHGFTYWLSEEDTGTGDKNHLNSTATEWWVVFFKNEIVEPAKDLLHGFLADDRTDHPCYERVPYAFASKTPDNKLDFVLISVHLKPDKGPAERARRRHELAAISDWIESVDESEKDFIILGDMNIYNANELEKATPEGFISLNDECRPTNTNLNSPEPYDHVMFRPKYTKEMDADFDMAVIDLIAAMEPLWKLDAPYPGDPYKHNEFRKYFSDHHPVVFKLTLPDTDDD